MAMLSQESKGFPYGASLLVSIVLLGLWNHHDFSRTASCADCVHYRGVPFSFIKWGGFAHFQKLIWPGILADAVALVVFAALLAFAWNRIGEKIARGHGNNR
jgi:hypothetical protein